MSFSAKNNQYCTKNILFYAVRSINCTKLEVFVALLPVFSFLAFRSSCRHSGNDFQPSGVVADKEFFISRASELLLTPSAGVLEDLKCFPRCRRDLRSAGNGIRSVGGSCLIVESFFLFNDLLTICISYNERVVSYNATKFIVVITNKLLIFAP